MLSTIINHYVIDFSINYVLNNYISEFTASKYITYDMLNSTYLNKPLKTFYHYNDIFELNGLRNNYKVNDKLVILSRYSLQIQNLMAYDKQYRIPIYDYNYNANTDFFCFMSTKETDNLISCTYLPFDINSSAILL